MATVILTQPEPRAGLIADTLRQAGIQSVSLSFSRLQALPDGLAQLRARLGESFDRIIFVSPSAVWFARSLLPAIMAACPRGIAVIGAGTESALVEQLGGSAKDVPLIRPEHAPFDADALLALPAMTADLVRSIVVVRGRQGRDDWIEGCRARGLTVSTVCLYERLALEPAQAESERLTALAATDESALIMVTSVAHARQLCSWGEGRPFAQWLQRQTCLVSHPRVATCLTDGGFSAIAFAPDQGSLVDAAIQWWRANPS